MDAWLASIEHSALAQAMRSWRWLYPLINTAHIVGIALVFGALAPLHLRTIGYVRRLDLGHLKALVLPVALAGFAIAICSGALMFTTDARKYAGLELFQVKLALILLAVMNAALVARTRTRWAAVLSLGLWVAVIACGRLIGYV